MTLNKTFFVSQGDLEKAQNIPVQMLNDRNTVSRPHSQIGFLEFLVAPLFLLQVARDAGSIPGSDN